MQRGLSPDVLMRLEGAEEIRGCFSDAGIRGDCRVDLPLDDQRRFMRRLDADRAYARGELNRIAHYQDRQFSDLREFMEATVVVRAALGRADLER